MSVFRVSKYILNHLCHSWTSVPLNYRRVPTETDDPAIKALEMTIICLSQTLMNAIDKQNSFT